jgi:hypothetical protein
MHGVIRAMAVLVCLLESSRRKARRRAVLRRAFQLAFGLLALEFPIPVAMAQGLQFDPLTPCRVVDTRNANGPFGGPSLSAGVARSFPIPSSACGTPSSAQAYSFNVTAIPPAGLGFVTVWAASQPQPGTSGSKIQASPITTPARSGRSPGGWACGTAPSATTTSIPRRGTVRAGAYSSINARTLCKSTPTH